MKDSIISINSIVKKSRTVLFLVPILLLSACPSPAGGEGAASSPIAALLPFVLIFVLFYFLILRPQRKQSQQRDTMLENLKRGDQVLTTGGIYGRILGISGDVVTLEIAKGVTVRAARSGVSGIADPDADKAKAKEEKSKK